MEELLTTREVAEKLSVSLPRVQQFVKAGRLTPIKKTRGRQGSAQFPLSAVEALARDRGAPSVILARTEGAIAKRVFAMFGGGATLPQVVDALEISPTKVRALYREWRAPLEKDVEPSAEEKDRKSRAEHDAFADDFEREQIERRAKQEAEHKKRMLEIEDLRTRDPRTKRKR